jgi:hypothetical protein
MPVRTTILFYVDNIVEYLNSIPHDYPIITSEMPDQQEPCILFNTEQLTRKRVLAKLLARLALSDVVELWDYSLANIEILKTNGVRIVPKHQPICVAPAHRDRLTEFLKAPKEFDVGFAGLISRRRRAILKGLKSAGLRVLIINRVNGDARDSALAKCRLLINIHYAPDYQIFESARCAQWLETPGSPPVLTEESLDNDSRAITVPYDKLVSTAVEVIRAFTTHTV